MTDTKSGGRTSKGTLTVPATHHERPGVASRGFKEAGSLRIEQWPSSPSSTPKERTIIEHLNLAI